MKYTNYFLNKKEYDESICNQVQDSLNYYKETKEFNFFDENETESYLIATYNVTSTTNATQLLGTSFTLSQITEMYVDDVKIDNVVNSYTFSSVGKHTVKMMYDKCNFTSCYYMFSQCNGLTSLDLSNFDTSKVTSMDGMFNNCNSLTLLDLSSFDTSKVTYMIDMFMYCSKLISITFGYNADVSKVTKYGDMFYNVPSTCTLTLCSNTQTSWDTLLSRVPFGGTINYQTCTAPTSE